MSDCWIKPDFHEIGVNGECTAYAGTQDAREANSVAARREENHGATGETPLPSKKWFPNQPEA